MKFINWFINRYATPSLFIGSIAGSITAIILLLSVIFNFKPYLSFNSGATFGFTNYAKGIPAKVSFLDPIPDTSINYQKENGGGLIYIFNNYPSSQKHDSQINDGKFVYADTITANYEVSTGGFNKTKAFSVNSFSFSEAKAYIKTENYFYKLLFMLPTIVLLLVICYASWQLGLLLDYIQGGEIFELINYKRLQNIGLLIIYFQLFCLLIGLIVMLTNNDWRVDVQFTSSIPHFRSPLIIHAEPDYGFEWYWLIAGCITVVIAKAFQKGYKLQQEQELTI